MLIKQNPHFWRGYFNLALPLAAAGRPDEAAQAIEVAAALNDHTALVAIHAHALAQAGDTTRAEAVWSQLASSGQYVSPYWQAYAAVGLGRHDVALNRLASNRVTREPTPGSRA